jgi:hypothetical protein
VRTITTLLALAAAAPVWAAGGTLDILPRGSQSPVRTTLPADFEPLTSSSFAEGRLVVGQEPGGIGLLVLGPDKSLVRLAAPLEATRSTVAALGDNEVKALAWLADEAGRGAVHAVVWTGDSWSSPEQVAPAGVGSQLALRAGTDSGGHAVLAWSSFDGEDNEILWSRHDGSRWSAPQRVGGNDKVPDVTPSLGTVDGVLTLAWSEWDGSTYRLRLARFEGDGWDELASLPERGASTPRFEADGILVYRDGTSRDWVARELDSSGNTRALAKFAQVGDAARPTVLADGPRAFWVDTTGASQSVEWSAP